MDPGTPMKAYVYDDIIIMTHCHHYFMALQNVTARESPSHKKRSFTSCTRTSFRTSLFTSDHSNIKIYFKTQADQIWI